MNEFQPSLFGPIAPIRRTPSVKGATIQQRFEQFHRDNPHIYARMRDLCLSMKRRGFSKWGAKAAWEVLRYAGVMSNGQEDFKLPNDFTSRYARKLMSDVPELADFFETRKLKS